MTAPTNIAFEKMDVMVIGLILGLACALDARFRIETQQQRFRCTVNSGRRMNGPENGSPAPLSRPSIKARA
jgi:hypothetical protein